MTESTARPRHRKITKKKAKMACGGSHFESEVP